MSDDRLGAEVTAHGSRFRIASPDATQLWLCLFDDDDGETRLLMTRDGTGIWAIDVPDAGPGTRYGVRADGPYNPSHALWFDPHKLLLDPYATAIDRPFEYDPALAAPRGQGQDTAALMPKGMVIPPLPPISFAPPRFRPGGLIYELQVRSFTMLHPDVPAEQRGTIGALAHPAIIDHLRRLHVSAIELMPITAWVDEPHLGPLGLRNAWGYNPASFFALDPRIAPRGIGELRDTVAALHAAGIGVILDMVFNHNGESDALGPTFSLRGLDARSAFRHDAGGNLINDTGTGNSIDCNHPAMQSLILASLRHFVEQAGVDGFRFDLTPALGRLPHGFDPNAPLLRALREDAVLADRILIAEPWDIGPGGYQLGGFGAPWLEWNDRYRDDMRRFWRGDPGMVGSLATRLAGSADLFQGEAHSRSVNFLAAHDGFTLRDIVSYAHRHNEANGEDNRDGHGQNFSWNSGVEGASDDPEIEAARRRDVKALLSTLFCSRGTIMLTAGDEFGRTQHGNNNSYAQDNAIGWLDWNGRDREIEAHAFALAAQRAESDDLSGTQLLTDADVEWLDHCGSPLDSARWEEADRRRLIMRYRGTGLAVCVNGDDQTCRFELDARSIEVPGRTITTLP